VILKKLEVKVAPTHITNCYIVADEKSKEAMILDPASEPDKIIDMIKVLGVKVKYIVLTHCHADHINNVPEIKKQLGGKVLIHRQEFESIKNPNITLFENLGLVIKKIEPDARIDDGDLIHLGDISFKVIHTPGHTKGSICLYCPEEKMLLSGDTLFSGAWGRTDLPTSSFEDIMASISNKLMILPEDTIVYPGHGRPTIVKEEAKVYLNLRPKLY